MKAELASSLISLIPILAQELVDGWDHFVKNGRVKIAFTLKQEDVAVFLLEAVDDFVIYISAADIFSQGFEVLCQLAELFVTEASLVKLFNHSSHIGL